MRKYARLEGVPPLRVCACASAERLASYSIETPTTNGLEKKIYLQKKERGLARKKFLECSSLSILTNCGLDVAVGERLSRAGCFRLETLRSHSCGCKLARLVKMTRIGRAGRPLRRTCRTARCLSARERS